MADNETLPTAPEFKAGDRVAITIAPDVVGEIIETLDNGWVMFKADGRDDAQEFHPGSFKPAP